MMCENNVRFNMLADFYEFTMSNGYFEKGKRDEIVYFDMFFQKNSRRRRFCYRGGTGAGCRLYGKPQI